MSTIYWRDDDETSDTVVSGSHPLPIRQMGPLPVVPLLPYFNGALSTTLATVQAGPTDIYMVEASNISAADAFIQFFDYPGLVTLGTTTPTLSLLVPKGDATNRGGMDKTLAVPIRCYQSLRIAATTTATGLTAPATALVVNMAVR